MEQRKRKRNNAHFKDDSDIISHLKIEKNFKFKRKENRAKTLFIKHYNKLIKEIKNILNEGLNWDKIDDRKLKEKKINIIDKHNDKIFHKDSFSKLASHSSSNLIKIDNIKNTDDDIDKNKSDDEGEKLEKRLKRKKSINKNLEEKENEEKQNELINESAKFNYNLKTIFNNNGINENEFELKFYKSEQKIRKLYYSKLLLQKVWIPLNDSRRHNSLIIFDWDDTILPTSFLTPRGIFDDKNELNPKDQARIHKLEETVKNLLSVAVKNGDIYIITNAGEGWVQFSANKYYPSVVEILNKIKVISARSLYESKYPNDSKKWKIEAFLNIKKNVNNDLITNIICLGDSVFEMEAGRILASKFIHAVIKTIKFRENPKPEELNKQLNLVYNQFNSIYTSSKNLTIRVEKKNK